MTQPRNVAANATAAVDPRPLSARSVVASTLLGVGSGRLPSRSLVDAAELFGINEGTTRVALSRMVAAGELEADDGHYRLAGSLAERHARQSASRVGRQRAWSIARGRWELAIVSADRRSAPERAGLRDAMRRLKLAELREGVWLRPDNLDPARGPDARSIVREQCRSFASRPDTDDPVELAAALWDLEGWAVHARELQRGLARYVGRLEAADTSVLASTFELSAAVLRHLLADPLLPDELLPGDWPGASLRADYDRYDAAFKALWRERFDRGR